MININILKINEKNPRKLREETRNQLEKSITNFGFVNPIITTKDYYVISGHQRLKILKENEVTELLCYSMGDICLLFPEDEIKVDKNKVKLLNIALNKISADWDYDLLDETLSELHNVGYNTQLTGFDEVNLNISDEIFFDDINNLSDGTHHEENIIVDDTKEIDIPDEILFTFNEYKFTIPYPDYVKWKHKLSIQTGNDSYKIKRIIKSRLDL